MKKRDNHLKGLKVVELAGVLAGPSAGLFLAEMGASVIKVENKRTGGDVTRSWKLPSEKKIESTSAYYHSVNFHKKVLFADFSNINDLTKIKKIIAGSDIVLANFKKTQEKKYGFTWTELKKINPKLIYATITGFGENSDRTAYDLILQAESGFMSMNGNEKSGPLKIPVALIDILAGHQLKEGILIALLKRQKTGKGSKVSVSLYDSALASLANQSSNYLNTGFVPGLQGSLHPNIAPYGEVFLTKDKKKIVFAIGSDQQFKKLCELLKLSKYSDSIKYATNQNRVKNRKSLSKILENNIKDIPSNILLSECIKNEIPAGIIKNLKDVFKEESARKLVVSKKYKNKNVSYVKSTVFKLSNLE